MLQQAVLIFIFSRVLNFEHWSFNISCATPKYKHVLFLLLCWLIYSKKNVSFVWFNYSFITHFVIWNSTNIKWFHCLLENTSAFLRIKILKFITVFIFLCFFLLLNEAISHSYNYKHVSLIKIWPEINYLMSTTCCSWILSKHIFHF